MSSDKYPDDSNRRRFVKGVVGGASLVAAGATAAASVDSVTNPSGAGGGTVSYFGIENTDGPAPRGMPQIPIEIDSEGFLKGVWPDVSEDGNVAEMEIAGETYSSQWFQYCGVQTYSGIAPDADQDNYFRYTSGSKYTWQNEEVSGGDKVHVDDFSDYDTWTNQYGTRGTGKPAATQWRSQDVEPSEVIPVAVIRSPLVEQKAAEEGGWLEATTENGFIAHLNKCTHFCCVPGFKTSNYQGAMSASDMVYCQCHQSIYDPFSLVKRSFTALPRPNEG
jgi:Rieske Fe-S protein